MGVQETFGKRLRELRGTLSQEEFAKKIGITRAMTSYYEVGARTADIEILKRVCRNLGESADWLLGLTDNRTPANQTVGRELGLSDSSVESLREFAAKGQDFLLQTINLLISEQVFDLKAGGVHDTVLQLMSAYLLMRKSEDEVRIPLYDGNSQIFTSARIEDIVLLDIQIALRNMRDIILSYKQAKGQVKEQSSSD